MQFFKDTNFGFVGKRKLGYIISATLLVISVASLVLQIGRASCRERV